MGYRVDRKVTLVLEEMPGAEVEVQIGIPFAALVEWSEAEGISGEWAAFVKWAQPTWNLEDAAGPIPVEASTDRVPLPVMRTLMRGWRDAAVNPPAPLPPESGSTEP